GWFHPIWALRRASPTGGRAKTRSGAVPFGEGTVDDVARGPERGFYIHFARIEQVRVDGRLQRRIGTAHVALVATLYVGEDGGEGAGTVLGLDLGQPAARAHLGARRDVKLHRRVRAHDGADVAPVEHRTAGLGGKGPLLV